MASGVGSHAVTRLSIAWLIAAIMAAASICVVGAALVGALWALIPASVGAAIGGLYGWRLSRAVDRLTTGAVRMASGGPGHRISPDGPPELRRLARAVNRIADQMNSVIQTEIAERSRLVSILDAMREGVLVVTADGTVESANPAVLEVLSAPAGFRPGQPLTSLTGNYGANQAAVECARTGTPRQAEAELHDSRKYVRFTAVPLGSQSGPQRALVLVTDLTDLRRVDVTRREFVSNASHELRTPIASIKAAVETLQRGALKDPEAAAEFVNAMAEDADRMEALVVEMLELSRLESGQTPLHMAPLDAASLLESVARQFKHQADVSGLTIKRDVQPELPPFNADRAQVERVLSNLVANALKFTPAGGSVTLSAYRRDRAVVLTVKDSGSGIAAEHLPHVFERFYKADQSRGSGGTGLGLAIAKHIVQAHGGAIKAESRLGEGAVFTFELPALNDK